MVVKKTKKHLVRGKRTKKVCQKGGLKGEKVKGRKWGKWGKGKPSTSQSIEPTKTRLNKSMISNPINPQKGLNMRSIHPNSKFPKLTPKEQAIISKTVTDNIKTAKKTLGNVEEQKNRSIRSTVNIIRNQMNVGKIELGKNTKSGNLLLTLSNAYKTSKIPTKMLSQRELLMTIPNEQLNKYFTNNSLKETAQQTFHNWLEQSFQKQEYLNNNFDNKFRNTEPYRKYQEFKTKFSNLNLSLPKKKENVYENMSSSFSPANPDPNSKRYVTITQQTPNNTTPPSIPPYKNTNFLKSVQTSVSQRQQNIKWEQAPISPPIAPKPSPEIIALKLSQTQSSSQKQNSQKSQKSQKPQISLASFSSSSSDPVLNLKSAASAASAAG